MNDSMWRSWGVSVVGPLHIKNGIPNQDSWISRKYKWGNVVVVSDGLGSNPHSDIGSKAACLAVIKAATAYQKNRQAKVEDILRLIQAYWLVEISPLSPSDCSATCLFAIRMDEKLILGRLGDGLIVVHGKSKNDHLALSDCKTNSFSEFTYCLTQEFRAAHWETVTMSIKKCRAIMLCTDGIADDLVPEKQFSFAKQLYSNYKDMASAVRLKNIRGWLNKWPVPGHSDDKTVVCLFKHGESK